MTAPQLNIAPDQVVRLKQLWGAGLSALECGDELGLTGEAHQIREAVLRAIEEANKPAQKIAKVVRPRTAGGPQSRSNLPPRHRTPAAVNDDDEDAMFASDGFDGSPTEWDLQIAVEQRRSLLGPPHSEYPARKDAECGWPVGEPKDRGFFYCGAPTHEDESYCPDHCRRAYHGHLHRRRAA